MKDLQGEEHAITFTEIDEKNQEFISHLTLRVGKNYNEGLQFFNNIQENYPEHKGESENEILIDFIDTDWSILDDYPLSKENARHLAMRLGHNLKV